MSPQPWTNVIASFWDCLEDEEAHVLEIAKAHADFAGLPLEAFMLRVLSHRSRQAIPRSGSATAP